MKNTVEINGKIDIKQCSDDSSITYNIVQNTYLINFNKNVGKVK